jgi:hypothetical protein
VDRSIPAPRSGPPFAPHSSADPGFSWSKSKFEAAVRSLAGSIRPDLGARFRIAGR